MHNTTTITRNELYNMLEALGAKGATMAELHTKTVPSKMRKTGNPFVDNVEKVSACNVTFGAIYENGVNRRLSKEAKPEGFKAKSNWFKHHKALSTLVEHKKTGEVYAYATLNRHTRPTVAYQTLNGDPIPSEEITPFIGAREGSKRQADAGLSSEKQVFPTTFKLDSIVGITVEGCTYLVKD